VDADAKRLAEALRNNMSLNCLDLSYNSFGEVGGIYLAAGLVSLIKTKYSVHGHDDIMLGIHLIWSIIYVSTHQP